MKFRQSELEPEIALESEPNPKDVFAEMAQALERTARRSYSRQEIGPKNKTQKAPTQSVELPLAARAKARLLPHRGNFWSRKTVIHHPSVVNRTIVQLHQRGRMWNWPTTENMLGHLGGG